MTTIYTNDIFSKIDMVYDEDNNDIIIYNLATPISAKSLFTSIKTKYPSRFRGAIVYSEKIIRDNICKTKNLMTSYFGDKYSIIWAMKSAPIDRLAQIAGEEQIAFDVGSCEEMRIAYSIAEGNRIYHTSPGKYDWDIETIIEHDCIPICDNITELQLLNGAATRFNKKVKCGIRINLMEDRIDSNRVFVGYKFGIHEDLQQFIDQVKTLSHLDIQLLHMHIGTQLSTPSHFDKALHKQLKVFDMFASAGIHIDTIDVGGGFPFNYLTPLSNDSITHYSSNDSFTSYIPYQLEDFLKRIHDIFTSHFHSKMPRIAIEPGRHIVAGSAFAIGYVLHCKRSNLFNWIISSISSNDIYHKSVTPDIHYEIYTICEKIGEDIPTAIGGPLCYYGDVITPINRSISLNSKIDRGDTLLINHVGAYSVTGSGNFHNMPRLPILMLDRKSNLVEIRPQETPYFE